jgi:hypothetical protein
MPTFFPQDSKEGYVTLELSDVQQITILAGPRYFALPSALPT